MTLTELHRFADPSEAAATLAIRDGDASALDHYFDNGRVHAGDVGHIGRGGLHRLDRRPAGRQVEPPPRCDPGHRPRAQRAGPTGSTRRTRWARRHRGGVGGRHPCQRRGRCRHPPERPHPPVARRLVGQERRAVARPRRPPRWRHRSRASGPEVPQRDGSHGAPCRRTSHNTSSSAMPAPSTAPRAPPSTPPTPSSSAPRPDSRCTLQLSRGREANHLYVGSPAATMDGVGLGLEEPAAGPRELLAAILERDGRQESAMTAVRGDAARELREAVLRYQDALPVLAQEVLGERRMADLDAAFETWLPGITRPAGLPRPSRPPRAAVGRRGGPQGGDGLGHMVRRKGHPQGW